MDEIISYNFVFWNWK